MERERKDLAQLLAEEKAAADTLRQALMRGNYPGMGAGHPDLYKAFSWRFWRTAADKGGWIGVVLPRSALCTQGSDSFRVEAFPACRLLDVTMLVNNREWVFPGVHPQYTIGLVSLCRGSPSGKSVRLRGPFPSLERFRLQTTGSQSQFEVTEVMSWTDSGASHCFRMSSRSKRSQFSGDRLGSIKRMRQVGIFALFRVTSMRRMLAEKD